MDFKERGPSIWLSFFIVRSGTKIYLTLTGAGLPWVKQHFPHMKQATYAGLGSAKESTNTWGGQWGTALCPCKSPCPLLQAGEEQ